jgi:hypothetical protein
MNYSKITQKELIAKDALEAKKASFSDNIAINKIDLVLKVVVYLAVTLSIVTSAYSFFLDFKELFYQLHLWVVVALAIVLASLFEFLKDALSIALFISRFSNVLKYILGAIFAVVLVFNMFNHYRASTFFYASYQDNYITTRATAQIDTSLIDEQLKTYNQAYKKNIDKLNSKYSSKRQEASSALRVLDRNIAKAKKEKKALIDAHNAHKKQLEREGEAIAQTAKNVLISIFIILEFLSLFGVLRLYILTKEAVKDNNFLAEYVSNVSEQIDSIKSVFNPVSPTPQAPTETHAQAHSEQIDTKPPTISPLGFSPLYNQTKASYNQEPTVKPNGYNQEPTVKPNGYNQEPTVKPNGYNRADFEGFSDQEQDIIKVLFKNFTVKHREQLTTRMDALHALDLDDNKTNTLLFRGVYKKLLEQGYIYKKIAYYSN